MVNGKIQGDPGEKVNNFGVDSMGHSDKKKFIWTSVLFWMVTKLELFESSYLTHSNFCLWGLDEQLSTGCSFKVYTHIVNIQDLTLDKTGRYFTISRRLDAANFNNRLTAPQQTHANLTGKIHKNQK